MSSPINSGRPTPPPYVPGSRRAPPSPPTVDFTDDIKRRVSDLIAKIKLNDAASCTYQLKKLDILLEASTRSGKQVVVNYAQFIKTAIDNGSDKALKKVLKKIKDAQWLHSRVYGHLHETIKNGDASKQGVVLVLIKNGAVENLRQFGVKHSTPTKVKEELEAMVLDAAKNGMLDVVIALSEKGVKVNQTALLALQKEVHKEDVNDDLKEKLETIITTAKQEL
jgi:hypothetical protein